MAYEIRTLDTAGAVIETVSRLSCELKAEREMEAFVAGADRSEPFTIQILGDGEVIQERYVA